MPCAVPVSGDQIRSHALGEERTAVRPMSDMHWKRRRLRRPDCVALGGLFLLVVAAPWSTVDLATADGSQIHIEMRDGAEVCSIGGVELCPPGAVGFNPAFDVTPARFIDAVVTERGVVCPNRGEDLSILAGQAQDVATR